MLPLNEITVSQGLDYWVSLLVDLRGRIYYLRLNQYAQAKKYFQQAYQLFEELEHNEQKVETLLELPQHMLFWM